MAQNAPGKHYRTGMSLIDAVTMLSDERVAEGLFIETRWPNGVCCPRCGSLDVKARPSRKPAPFRCNGCRADFSVKTDTVMQGSNLPLSKWALAAYLMTTNLKGVSSMKLHRDLGITQKTAWHLAHRIRTAWESDGDQFAGPTEVDETYMGGKERNKHESKKLHAGRGAVGKTAVVGAKDRETGKVRAKPVAFTDREALQGFVGQTTDEGTTVYTDEAAAYQGMPNRLHRSVRHSVGEYVRQQAHTNGIESFWAMLKRGYHGVYHQMSPHHLRRYVTEFEGRHNDRPADTIDQLRHIFAGMVGRRLRYQDLVAQGPAAERRGDRGRM